MSRTYRRKNNFKEKNYVDSFFVEFEHEDFSLFFKNDRSLKDKKTRKAWYHSDNFKPLASSALKSLKSESNETDRAKNKHCLVKIKALYDYESFDCFSYHHKKNDLKYSIFY